MAEKKHVLVFIDWYLPGFRAGGPVRSVKAIVQLLSGDFRFSIVTSDTDFGAASPYDSVKADEWNQLPDGTRVLYCSVRKQTRDFYAQVLRKEQPDIVYFNSLFSRPFTITPLRLVKKILPSAKVILAPRGMLGEGALQLKKGKKKLFLSLAKLTGLYRDLTWHASSEQEEKEIRAVFGRQANVRIAMNLSAPVLTDFRNRKKEAGTLHLFFLSRISPKKNLLKAIQLLNQSGAVGMIRFTIYGPVEDAAYWTLCENEMKKAPAGIQFSYNGEITHGAIAPALADEHFLFFPTHHENFGHVILEAFAASCPVIISDQTPWKGLKEKQIGWELPLSKPELFTAAILEALAMNQEQYSEWAGAAYRYAEAFAANNAILEANRRLFS